MKTMDTTHNSGNRGMGNSMTEERAHRSADVHVLFEPEKIPRVGLSQRQTSGTAREIKADGDVRAPMAVAFGSRLSIQQIGQRVLLALAMGIIVAAAGPFAWGAEIRVPENQATIPKAIDAARPGDTITVAPGTYRVALKIDKTVILASRHLTSGDPRDIETTILDGGDRNGRPGGAAVITVGKKCGPETRITGFTIRNGDDGIYCSAAITVDHNRFLNNTDAIDYEGGGGVCRDNHFEGNRDDAVDLDGPCAVLVENNLIRGNRDDGIEIRLHPYQGPRLVTVIRNNRILNNGEDGIQLIDYDVLSDRLFVIEGNVIAGTAQAAIGCMDKGDSREDYRSSPIPEKVYLFNNTLVDNAYGLTGGANMVVVNNIIGRTKHTAIKACAGRSVLRQNLLWANGRNFEPGDLGAVGSIEKDPLLDELCRPRLGSPAIGAGMLVRPLIEKDLPGYRERPFTGNAPALGALDTPASEPPNRQ